MYNLNYLLITIGLAVLPSLVWFFFYLKEDAHPEPRYWLFIIFLTGAALAPLVIFLEMTISRFFSFASILYNLEGFFLIIIIAPLVEEIAKYGVTHLALNKTPVLDEPVDGMIYVITAALGFAAIENVFAIFSFVPPGLPGYFGATLNFISLRFITAVALHGLAPGIVGYFFAKYYFIKRNVGLIFVGLVSAIALHGAYNFLIVRNDSAIFLILTGILLGGATALVIHLFNRLKHYTAYQQASIDEVVENKI